jgi:integrase
MALAAPPQGVTEAATFLHAAVRFRSMAITSESFLFRHALDDSSPRHPDSTTRASPRSARAGVTGARRYDLRHHVATRLLTAGVDVRTVAGRLGHRNRKHHPQRLRFVGSNDNRIASAGDAGEASGWKSHRR